MCITYSSASMFFCSFSTSFLELLLVLGSIPQADGAGRSAPLRQLSLLEHVFLCLPFLLLQPIVSTEKRRSAGRSAWKAPRVSAPRGLQMQAFRPGTGISIARYGSKLRNPPESCGPSQPSSLSARDPHASRSAPPDCKKKKKKTRQRFSSAMRTTLMRMHSRHWAVPCSLIKPFHFCKRFQALD